MIETFEVLAEPDRRRILDLLRAEERPVGELVRLLAASQPAVSKHLRVLREAGLVEVRVDALQAHLAGEPPLRSPRKHWDDVHAMYVERFGPGGILHRLRSEGYSPR